MTARDVMRVRAAGRERFFELEAGEHGPGVVSYYVGSFDVAELHVEAAVELLEGGSCRVTLSALDDAEGEGIAVTVGVAMVRAIEDLASCVRREAEELQRIAVCLQEGARR